MPDVVPAHLPIRWRLRWSPIVATAIDDSKELGTLIHSALKGWAVVLAASSVCTIAAMSSPVAAFAAEKSAPRASASTQGFDDEPSLWKFFFDCHPPTPSCPSIGQASATSVPSPSTDGQSLKISYLRGNSFMGVDAFHPFPAVPSARRFQLNYKFFFQDSTPIQGLEFAANQYFGGWRYEWGMQWEHFGNNDGAPQWRIWDGNAVKWRPIGFPQNLSNATWYDIQINGDIQGAPGPLFVHYIDFTIWPNGTAQPQPFNLGTFSFGAQQCPPPHDCNAIIPAVQLDG